MTQTARYIRVRLQSVTVDLGEVVFNLVPELRASDTLIQQSQWPTYQYYWGVLKRQQGDAWVEIDVWDESQFLRFLAAETDRPWTSDDWRRLLQAWVDGFQIGRKAVE